MQNNEKMANIAINKSVLKEYENDGVRTVYMQNGTEYQIALFNPTQGTIGAEIIIDGDTLGSKIVLRPGERVWLERFINNDNKFLFESYTDDISDILVRNAIKNNGIVEIKFYKKEPEYNNNLCINDFPDWNNIKIKSPTRLGYYRNNIYYGDITTSNLGSYSAATTKCMASMDSNIENLSCKSACNNLHETDITSYGEKSEQKLKQTSINFCYSPFTTEKIQLLPLSEKPMYKEDVEKRYCTECGSKIKPKYKYCPVCGTKI